MDTIEHRVRERAYYIWEREGCVAGRDEAHWIQAEIELAAAEVSVKKAPARAKAPAKAAAKPAAKAAAKPKKAARPAASGIALH